MDEATSELRYHRTLMRREPVNIGWDALVERLRGEDAARVVLEPGDGTRYDLVLARVRGGLFLTRYVGGDPIGTELVTAWTVDEAAALLRNSNAWSAQLLAWWLRQVLQAVAHGGKRGLL